MSATPLLKTSMPLDDRPCPLGAGSASAGPYTRNAAKPFSKRKSSILSGKCRASTRGETPQAHAVSAYTENAIAISKDTIRISLMRIVYHRAPLVSISKSNFSDCLFRNQAFYSRIFPKDSPERSNSRFTTVFWGLSPRLLVDYRLCDNFRPHQEVHKTNIGDAVLISVIRLDPIYDHQLAERIRNPPQPPDLLFAFCRVWHSVG